VSAAADVESLHCEGAIDDSDDDIIASRFACAVNDQQIIRMDACANH
jgi:hypothetical protein